MNRTSTNRGTGRRIAILTSLLTGGVMLQTGSANAVDFGPWMYDWNQDGYVDASALDVTGDGYLDSNLVQFSGATGYTWLVDLNQNGEADLVGHDADRDTFAEVWFLDADEDDVAEASTQVGRLTTSTSGIQPGIYETSSGGGSITLRQNPAGGTDIVIGMDPGMGYGGGPIVGSASVTTSSQPWPYSNDYGCRPTDDADSDGTVDCHDRSPREPELQ